MTHFTLNRSRPTEPTAPPAGYQHWSNLAFVHWRVPARILQGLIPQPLSIDTWEGDAWLGMVAFSMSEVRPAWGFALPYLSTFPETNLRTYVHFQGAEPGVWFFTLDASRWLAVQAARFGWGLNYRWSRMRVTNIPAPGRAERATCWQYRSRRWLGEPGRVDMRLVVSPGQKTRTAEPDSLEYFLCERYLLYTLRGGKQLWKARVYHTPYPLQDAELLTCEQSLADSIGFPLGWPKHVIFSPGVRVSVYGLERAQVDSEVP